MPDFERRSVRLPGEQIRALIEAAHYAIENNETLTEENRITLRLVQARLQRAIGNLNFDRAFASLKTF